MPDLAWLNGLEGKTKDIAQTLYGGKLKDAEIASKHESTVGYVQKVKSQMRAHDFVLERGPTAIHSKKEGTDVGNAIKQAETMLTDRITREDLRKIYADFKQGLPMTDIAIKHGLPPDLLMGLWRGWMQMTGRNKIVRLCDLYGDQGVIQFYKIGQYLNMHNHSPEQMVDLLHSIGSLQQYQSELESDISTAEERRNILNEQLVVKNNIMERSKIELEGIQKNIENTNQELITVQTRIEKLKDEESYTKQSIDKLVNDGYKYVYDVASVAASDILNDVELREIAFKDLLDVISNHPEKALFLLEAIAKGLETNVTLEEFAQKYVPLLSEYRKKLLQRITQAIKKDVSRQIISPIGLVNSESQSIITPGSLIL